MQRIPAETQQRTQISAQIETGLVSGPKKRKNLDSAERNEHMFKILFTGATGYWQVGAAVGGT